MKTKQKSLSDRQQKKILQAARVCFVKQGLSKTTMRDIAAQAEMSLGNIYRYFKNKEALVEGFVASDRQTLEGVFASLETCSDFKEGVTEIARGVIYDLSVQSELMIYVDILSKALREEDKGSLISLESDVLALEQQLEIAQKNGRISLSLTPQMTSMALMAFIENAALKCITREEYVVEQGVADFSALLNCLISD